MRDARGYESLSKWTGRVGINKTSVSAGTLGPDIPHECTNQCVRKIAER